MADSPLPTKRAFYTSRALRTTLAFVVAYAIPMVLARAHIYRLIDMALWRLDDGLNQIFMMFSSVLSWGYVSALFVAQILVVLGFLARTLARARVRAGHTDPLERIRAFAKSSAHQMELTVAPAVLWGLVAGRMFFHGYWDRRAEMDHQLFAYLPGFVVPMILVLLGQIVLARRGLAALVAPTLDESETGEAAEESRADGFTFDAVAVTRETRAAVGGLAALSVAMTALAVSMPVSHMRDPAFLAGVAAYVAVAGGAALLFRRASRVAVGLDGVHVHGSSRSRFYAYGELDGARANGGDIQLLRGTRVVLTLQLHGKDAARRDALVKRLDAAITRASEERDEPAVSFVNSASQEDLVRAAEGGGSYRRLAVSRDQLWSALEGPSVAASARRAAAEALAGSTDPSERARFRIAAEQCAEPAVRVRMRELIEEEEDEPATVGPTAKRATLSR